MGSTIPQIPLLHSKYHLVCMSLRACFIKKPCNEKRWEGKEGDGRRVHHLNTRFRFGGTKFFKFYMEFTFSPPSAPLKNFGSRRSTHPRSTFLTKNKIKNMTFLLRHLAASTQYMTADNTTFETAFSYCDLHTALTMLILIR